MTRNRVWDIIIHEEEETTETIRGLTQAQTIALMSVFDRCGISAEAVEYDIQHHPTGERDAVNF